MSRCRNTAAVEPMVESASRSARAARAAARRCTLSPTTAAPRRSDCRSITAPTCKRDASWNDTPLGWAIVGSGQRPQHNPHTDWVATVEALLDAGAPIDGIRLSTDDPEPPSPEVAQLLRDHGIPDETPNG
jgi:hypothetical protein